MNRRVLLIVLNSCGIGEEPDVAEYGDEGNNTLAVCATNPYFHMPNPQKLGFFSIGEIDCRLRENSPTGAFGYLQEASKGKDTTVGHWEISDIYSPKSLPMHPEGFPKEVICEFEEKTGRRVLCNKLYPGTDIIRDYGKERVETGALIVYTSAGSMFQTVTRESIVSPEELYHYCRIARKILKEEHSVGRVITRLFTGEHPNFTHTSGWHDFSVEPPAVTVLD